MTDEEFKLLRRFVESRSEEAFAELVRRQVNLVYSAALRLVAGDRHLAEDVSQTVFSDFARKAGTLTHNVLLSGWLYRHTFFVASTMIRTERRRRAREQETAHMNTPASEPDWTVIAAALDGEMNKLNRMDRDAILLRFFEKLDLQTVGERLGVSEDAAQKRVGRALEKLRTSLSKTGLTIPSVALGTLLSANAVIAAPATLSATTVTAVLGGTALTSGIIVTLNQLAHMKTVQLAAPLSSRPARPSRWFRSIPRSKTGD